MEATKTHYKKMVDTNWIGTWVLPEGKDINVTLTKVVYVKTNKVMGKVKPGFVAIFAPNPYFDKPMLLNATNQKRVAKLIGSTYVEDWESVNVDVTLCQEMDKCVTGGQDWALRFKTERPVKVLPVLELSSENFINCKSAIESGKFTIDQVKSKYNVSPDVELKLLEKNG